LRNIIPANIFNRRPASLSFHQLTHAGQLHHAPARQRDAQLQCAARCFDKATYTLKGSKHANMKELRFEAGGGAWRVAFAFDPKRQAVVLVAGDKRGVAQARFYKALIAKADRRFGKYLETVRER
jgi:hypothetical protein